jgi:hypothetical protein
MKKNLLLLFSVFAFSLGQATNIFAWGAGVVVGNPTGISFQSDPLSYGTAQVTYADKSRAKITYKESAINGAIAWNVDPSSSFFFDVDYVLYNLNWFASHNGRLPFYFGIGAEASFNSRQSHVGIRVPVGIEYRFPKSPIQIFGEVVPILDLSPSTTLELKAGVGIRFLFE